MTEPSPETSSVNRVSQAAQDLLAALQDLAKEQISGLPTQVQETLKQTIASLEKVIADFQANANQVATQGKEQVKEIEERVVKAWEVLSAPKSPPVDPLDPPNQ